VWGVLRCDAVHGLFDDDFIGDVMSDPLHPTTDELWFRDPDLDPPPRACSLLLLNPGGVLIVGNWTDDCLGWCPKPKIPKSIKDKVRRNK
jgi:hypothetical protein